MPDYSIPSGKRKHFRINPLSFHFFLPLFTLRKLIYIPQNKETHHIYKISIPKISKHTFIPAKISTFRIAKMGCLSAPRFRYFPLFTGILPLLLPKDMFPQTTISCGIHTIFHFFYTISRASRATVSTWHERIASTSFAGRFVRLDPPLFLPFQSYVGTYLLAMYF